MAQKEKEKNSASKNRKNSREDFVKNPSEAPETTTTHERDTQHETYHNHAGTQLYERTAN